MVGRGLKLGKLWKRMVPSLRIEKEAFISEGVRGKEHSAMVGRV